jgi:hypothetical protein
MLNLSCYAVLARSTEERRERRELLIHCWACVDDKVRVMEFKPEGVPLLMLVFVLVMTDKALNYGGLLQSLLPLALQSRTVTGRHTNDMLLCKGYAMREVTRLFASATPANSQCHEYSGCGAEVLPLSCW